MDLKNANKAVMLDEVSLTSKAQSASSQATVPRSIDIRIVTHNVRYATESPFKGEEHWVVRCPRLCSALVFNSQPLETFICLQEVLNVQLEDIFGALNSSVTSEHRWAYIGAGRDNGQKAGEYSPIFFRPSFWHLRQWETRWMSETPNVPSKGWDAANPRIVTIGEFEHIRTGQKTVFMSTHFDNMGIQSRRESSKIILGAVKDFTRIANPAAILLGGDFNSPPYDDAYKIMTSKDSRMEDITLQIPEEKRYGNEMTFTSFGYIDNEPNRIDFIFSRKDDSVKYKTYSVLANRFDDGVYHSDHRACVADLQLFVSY